MDSFYIVRLGEQGEWRQADGNFNIYNAREERGESWPHHTLPVNCHPWLGCRQGSYRDKDSTANVILCKIEQSY